MHTFLAVLSTIACLLFFPIGLVISLVAAASLVVVDAVRELIKALKDTWKV